VHHCADTHEDIVIELPAEHLEHPGCIGAVECDFKHADARGGQIHPSLNQFRGLLSPEDSDETGPLDALERPLQ